MAEPADFDNPGTLQPVSGPGRIRQAITIAVVGLLVVSMAFLAWVSGRGAVSIEPAQPTTPAAPSLEAVAPFAVSPRTDGEPRLAVVAADGRLFTMDRRGNGIVRLGTRGTRYQFPAWSPDGGRIAAIGVDGTTSAVQVLAEPGHGEPGSGGTGAGPSGGIGAVPPARDPTPPTAIEPAVLYDAADRAPFYLFWAPDGRSVGFLTTEPAGLALRAAPIDGSAPATVVRQASPMYWTWVDGGRLLVHSGDGPASFFGEVAVADGAGDALENASGGFRAPGLSASGRFRGFATHEADTGFTVVLAAVDGSIRHEVPTAGGAALSFDPMGDTLAFVAPTTPSDGDTLPIGPLRLIDPRSGEARVLLATRVVAFFWSPDGRTIAAVQVPDPDAVAAADTGPRSDSGAGSAQAPEALEAGLGLDLVFVDVVTGTVRSQQDVRLPDGFAGQVLPFFDQYALSHHVWAPDSSAIALPVVDDAGETRIHEFGADGSAAREIAPGILAFWSP